MGWGCTVGVELRELRWAIIVSQHPSLRQAAETLNVRQSTLSRRLRYLEHQLDAKLFERTNAGTKLTAAGQEFVDAARGILDEAEAMTVRLRTRSRGENGCLTVGVHAAFSAGNLRATLIDYRQRFPDVRVSMVDGSSDHLISNLASSSIDIAFVAEENPRWGDKVLSVWSERVVIAVPDGHPLSGRDIVRWPELRNELLLVPQRGPGAEFMKLLLVKVGYSEPCRVLRQDAGIDVCSAKSVRAAASY